MEERRFRRRTALPVLLALLAPPAAVAQTPAPSAELHYALNQLKAKQDRLNEQATELQKLRDKVAELEKKSYATPYALREHYAAWQQFIDANPRIRAMWTAFFPTPASADRARDLLGDPGWPFSV